MTPLAAIGGRGGKCTKSHFVPIGQVELLKSAVVENGRTAVRPYDPHLLSSQAQSADRIIIGHVGREWVTFW